MVRKETLLVAGQGTYKDRDVERSDLYVSVCCAGWHPLTPESLLPKQQVYLGQTRIGQHPVSWASAERSMSP